MTMRTSYRVDCPCGHVGAIRRSENDAPFSRPWESYEPIDLEGSEFTVEPSANWTKVFEEMSPRCPKCGTRLMPDDLHRP